MCPTFHTEVLNACCYSRSLLLLRRCRDTDAELEGKFRKESHSGVHISMCPMRMTPCASLSPAASVTQVQGSELTPLAPSPPMQLLSHITPGILSMEQPAPGSHLQIVRISEVSGSFCTAPRSPILPVLSPQRQTCRDTCSSPAPCPPSGDHLPDSVASAMSSVPLGSTRCRSDGADYQSPESCCHMVGPSYELVMIHEKDRYEQAEAAFHLKIHRLRSVLYGIQVELPLPLPPRGSSKTESVPTSCTCMSVHMHVSLSHLQQTEEGAV